MKLIRYATVLGGLAVLVLALGFSVQLKLATNLWPWPDGRYSYLFIGSILAAVGAAAVWIGWSGELGALPAGSLNVFVITAAVSAYFFHLSSQAGRSNLLPYAIAELLMAVASAAAFFWSSRIPLRASIPTPALVRVSFGVFIAALFLAGGALVLGAQIFPWKLNPESAVIFGCIFLGDAFYFLHGLFRPRWNNARGQLLSFLAYDLVLIVPFAALFKTVQPGRMLNLVVYLIVLIYSAAVAVYFLFIDPRTRFGARTED
jgi:hypothetical protein